MRLSGSLNTAPQHASGLGGPRAVLANFQARAIGRAARSARLASAATLDIGALTLCKRLTESAIGANPRDCRPFTSQALAIERTAQALAIAFVAARSAVTELATVNLADALARASASGWTPQDAASANPHLAIACANAAHFFGGIETALLPPPTRGVDAGRPRWAISLLEQRTVRRGAVDGVATTALCGAPNAVGRAALESKLAVTPSLARATFANCTVITGVTGIILSGRTTHGSLCGVRSRHTRGGCIQLTSSASFD